MYLVRRMTGKLMALYGSAGLLRLGMDLIASLMLEWLYTIGVVPCLHKLGAFHAILGLHSCCTS